MYTSIGDIQKYTLTDIDVSFVPQVESWIQAVESYINNYTGRLDGFENTTSTTRYFDGNGKREIDVGNFASLSSVEILNYNSDDVDVTLSEGKASDYLIYPYNTSPKYRLILTINSQVPVWSVGDRRIKLTGIFGQSTVPFDIKLAATILATEIIKQGRDGGLKISENEGDYSASFETFDRLAMRITNVRSILDRYKILEL